MANGSTVTQVYTDGDKKRKAIQEAMGHHRHGVELYIHPINDQIHQGTLISTPALPFRTISLLTSLDHLKKSHFHCGSTCSLNRSPRPLSYPGPTGLQISDQQHENNEEHTRHVDQEVRPLQNDEIYLPGTNEKPLPLIRPLLRNSKLFRWFTVNNTFRRLDGSKEVRPLGCALAPIAFAVPGLRFGRHKGFV